MNTQSTPSSTVDLNIKEAAKLVGVCSNDLYEELRKRGYINKENIAFFKWVHAGFFRTKNGTHRMGKTGYQKPHCTTLVTDKGMALISEVAEQIKERRNKS